MSSNRAVHHDGDSKPRRAGRSRSVALVAATLAAGLTVGVVATAGGGSAGAATTYSTKATGKFLGGTIAGLNLDSVAGIEGESAANNYGATVTNKNSLKAELLNKAIEIPLQNGLQLPGLNVLQLGAVGQYATASPDGSALGATGAVSNSGGVGLGGSNGEPATATLDLAGLGGSQLASLLNVQAGIGAISSGAVQAPASGSRSASKQCASAGVEKVTVKDGDQAGLYCIASVDLTLSVPVLAQILKLVSGAVDPIIATLNSGVAMIANQLPGTTISVPSLSSLLSSLSSVSLADGAITADLNTGKITVSVDKLLKSLGLDINDLPVDTSLVPYIVKALQGLPAALAKTVSSIGTVLTNLLSNVTVHLGGVDVGGIVAGLIKTVLNTASTALSAVLTPLTSALNTIANQSSAITDLLARLLDIVVNHRTKSGGVLSETAILLKIGSGLGLNGALAPIINTLGSLLNGKLPTAASSAVASNVTSGQSSVRSAAEDAAAKAKALNAKKASKATTLSVKPSTKVKNLAVSGTVRSAAASDVTDVLVSLNLAQSTVGPSTARSTSSTPTTAPPTSNGDIPTSAVPTGVPAGAGSHGGSPTLPLMLILLTIGLAAGGVATYRIRGARGSH